MDGHESAEALDLEVSDLVHGGHVVVSDLENAVLAVGLEADVGHELRDGLAEEGLEPVVLLHDARHEVEAARLVEPKLKQVREVHEDRHLLLSHHLVRKDLVVLYRRSLCVDVLLCTLQVSVVVHIILAQLETIKFSK